MQKRILFITTTLGVLVLFVAGSYYIAAYLPKKQKAEMDLVKLELEAKIEQEKTEQLKMEQENRIREEDNKRLEEEKQQKLTDEANQQAEAKKKQQSASNTSLSKCLANADEVYTEKASRIQYPSSNGDSIISMLNANRIQARNECYK